jgi:transcription elongation factor Elf1
MEMNTLMTKNPVKPEIPGTRTGYVIRFTCPECTRENIIITKTAKDHYKETHFGTCKQCRSRSTILTPFRKSLSESFSRIPVHPTK